MAWICIRVAYFENTFLCAVELVERNIDFPNVTSKSGWWIVTSFNKQTNTQITILHVFNVNNMKIRWCAGGSRFTLAVIDALGNTAMT